MGILSMTAVAPPIPRRHAPLADDQCVVLPDQDWSAYDTVLALRGERARPKLVYLDGDLYLMSPAYSHERLAERLGDLVKLLATAASQPWKSARSTTFRSRSKRGGAEADGSFYLASASLILGKSQLDLDRDPPPDLVIEVVHTHAADAAVEVWRRLGVPEVWVADSETLRILVRQPDESYAAQTMGLAFPDLTAAELLERATHDADGLDSDWHESVRRWVAGPLADRRRAAMPPAAAEAQTENNALNHAR